MPLHLLGKKSWNVYNRDNIERVKRDEAAAAAKEAEEERRQQESDAARRIEILRGRDGEFQAIANDDATEEAPLGPEEPWKPSSDRRSHDRKKRKRGEDDTDRDMRYAMESLSRKADGKSTKLTGKLDAPITDRNGHISLFPEQDKAGRRGERDQARGMSSRSKPPGHSEPDNLKQAVGESPWYAKAGKTDSSSVAPRDEEEENRAPKRKPLVSSSSADPLLAMQRGVQGVRKVERERARRKDEQDRDIRKLIKEERRKERGRKHEGRSKSHSHGHNHRHRDSDRDSRRSGERDG